MIDDNVETDNRATLRRLALMDKVQLVIAVSAVLISAASFYATYLQAQSEKLQVKAATWPYLEVSSGNFDVERNEERIYYKLMNSGVGPAILKSFSLGFDGEYSDNPYDIFQRCCVPEDAETGYVITGGTGARILPAGGEILVFRIDRGEKNGAFYERMDKERFNLTAKACYCSLLERCYSTDFSGDIEEVEQCGAAP